MIDALKLAIYADAFATRHERRDKGTIYPTVRQAAKRFKCRQQDVLDCIDGCVPEGFEYFDIAVGMRTGSGVGDFDNEGDYLIEAERSRGE